MTSDAREHHFGERNTRHVRQQEINVGCVAECKSMSLIFKGAEPVGF